MSKLTQGEFEALQALAKAKGVPVCEEWLRGGIERYPYIADTTSIRKIIGKAGKGFPEEEIVSFKETMEWLLQLDYVKVKLNKEIVAIIKDKVVEIENQTVSHQAIERLYQAIQKRKEI